MSLTESGAYPPGAEHDPRAPYNQDEDTSYADAEKAIEALNGMRLYESSSHDIDADLDVFDIDLPKYDSSRSWEELGFTEQALWNTYAALLQCFAYAVLER